MLAEHLGSARVVDFLRAGQDGEQRYDDAAWTHMALKNATAEVQWEMVTGQAW